jgi:predicted transcriptional regulator
LPLLSHELDSFTLISNVFKALFPEHIKSQHLFLELIKIDVIMSKFCSQKSLLKFLNLLV